MGVQLGRRRIGDRGSLDDKGVCEEAAGNNCGVYHREDDLKTVHKRGEYGGIQ